MALDLETLLAPVSDDNPVGEDLSYDNERAELEQVFQRDEFAEGDGEEAPERDWRGVFRLIENQFARSKDVWLAAYLTRAGAESGELETVQLGAEALAGLFERYWPTVHPQLEELGVPGRKAPCDALATRATFLAPLERVVLLAHPRLGRFTGADFERFRLEGASADNYGMFRAALEDAGEEGLQASLARLEATEAALRRADQAFTAGAEGEEGPNFSPTYATLGLLKHAVRAFLAGEEAAGAEEGEADTGGGDAGGGVAGGGRAIAGAVNTRDDVVRALGLIGDYYRNREPGHPMPLLLERAKQWVNMDFMRLMHDIAPGGLSEAETILKNRPEPDDSY